MKKFFLLIIVLLTCGSAIYAQERTEITKGLYLVRYGNVAVIEDDIHNCTIQLKSEKTNQKDSYGRQLYNVFCGNKKMKSIAKISIKSVITSLITSAATAIGTATGGVAGGIAGASAGSFISQYANAIADIYYDDFCEYFNEQISD